MSEPVPMLLHCPVCYARHIDEGEFATKPHHTHACQTCGMTWRPAVVPTVGVQFLPGFKNETAPLKAFVGNPSPIDTGNQTGGGGGGLCDQPKRRTRAEVLAAKSTVCGCCNRNADNMACDCLRDAVD